MKDTSRSHEAQTCLSRSENAFAFITAEGREAFCRLGPITVYPPATELFCQGSSAQGVFCIHSGLVKLTNVTFEGNELIVGLRSSGWILGAASVVIEKPHPVSAVTLTQCRSHFMSSDDFVRFLKLNGEFCLDLLRLCSCELNDQTSQLATLGTLRARQRLEQLLLRMTSSKAQLGMRLKLPLKLEEVAQMIAVRPEHLSRVLRQIEEEGIIQRKKGWIIVLDPQRLFHSNRSQ